MARMHNKQAALRGSGLGLLVIGFIAGAVVASLYFGLQRDVESPIGGGIRGVIERAAQQQQDGADEGESSGGTTTAKAALPEPEYGFYTFLPEIEQVLPSGATQTQAVSGDVADAAAPADTTASDSAAAATYVLQVGAYTKRQDAESVRARLALIGFESHTQKVSIEGQGDFYRVRLGPFAKHEAMREMQERLVAQGLRSISLKLGGGRG